MVMVKPRKQFRSQFSILFFPLVTIDLCINLKTKTSLSFDTKSSEMEWCAYSKVPPPTTTHNFIQNSGRPRFLRKCTVSRKCRKKNAASAASV